MLPGHLAVWVVLATAMTAAAQVPTSDEATPARASVVDSSADVASGPADAALFRAAGDSRAWAAAARFIAADDAPRLVTWKGRVKDLRQRPIPGVRAWLIPNGRSMRAMGLSPRMHARGRGKPPGLPSWFEDVPLELLPSAVTDAHGRFELSAAWLAPLTDVGDLALEGLGHAVLVLAGPGYALRAEGLEDPAKDMVRLQDVVLEPEARLMGTVVDGSGTPLSDVRVRVLQRNAHPAASAYGRYYPHVAVPEFCEVWTDASGRFELGSLWPGEVMLEVRRPHFQRLVIDPVAIVPGAQVMPEPLALQPGGMIGGLVRDAEGLPVAGAQVFAVTAPLSQFGFGCVVGSFQGADDSLPVELSRRFDADSVHALSGSDGSFRLVDLPEGLWTIYAMASGHESCRVGEVAPGTLDVSIMLPPEARWHVRVFDEDSGQPVAGVRIEARRLGRLGPLTQDAPSDGFGTVMLDVLADDDGSPGSWMIRGAGTVGTQVAAWAPGYVPQWLILQGVASGTEHRLEVRLSRESATR